MAKKFQEEALIKATGIIPQSSVVRRRPGPKTIFDNIDPNLLKHLYILGHTDEEVAFALNVRVACLWRHKNREEIRGAIELGKKIADERVEQALFKKATGFTYEEITREPIITTNINGEKVLVERKLHITKKVTKYVPPETAACMVWLRNRKAENWKDTNAFVNVNNTNNNVVQVVNKLKPEEITEDHVRACERNFTILRKYGVISPEVSPTNT